MYDAASQSDAPALQRAVGELRVDMRARDGRTVLEGLRQAGCLKARFPRPEHADWASIVTLNTSGGIAGGDALNSSFTVRDGARATIAAQAAERFYRALPGSAASHVRTRISAEARAAVEWLPQETILFDHCALDRRLDVEMATDSWFLGVESLVFGRAAMGETVEVASLYDVIRVRRAGRLLLHDAVRVDGDVAATLRRPAIADGARAVATLVHVAPDAEAALDAVREALASHTSPGPLAGEVAEQSEAGEGAADGKTHSRDAAASRPLPLGGRGVQGGASAWDGMLVARMLAADGAALRMAVTDVLRVLRTGRPLPRVWLC